MRARGFTLIELMISSTLAILLAAVATTAFLHIRRAVDRSEARLAMHAKVGTLFTNLHRSLLALQPSCALVIESVARDHPDGGRIRLLYMRSKEHGGDWQSGLDATDLVTDLVWEQWLWERADGRLSIGSSTVPHRTFKPGSSFAPNGDVDFRDRTFSNLPKPRRWLDPDDPLGADPGGLDDNIYFPSTGDPAISAAHEDDVGDFTDLERNLLPMMDGVGDLSFELIAYDGSTLVVDDSVTTDPPIVRQGVWTDGRMAPDLTGAPAFATSDLAKRPILLRLRITLVDARLAIEETFSFSFALPGLANPP